MPVDDLGALAWANIETLRKGNTREADTRRLVIDVLLAHAGYEIWKADAPNRVESEAGIEGSSATGGHGSCDYLLFRNGIPHVALEAKRLGSALTDADAHQVFMYCVVFPAVVPKLRWCVLTNGVKWRLYDAELPGAAKDRLVHEWTIEGAGQTFCDLLGPQHGKRLTDLVATLNAVKNPGHRIAIINHELSQVPTPVPGVPVVPVPVPLHTPPVGVKPVAVPVPLAPHALSVATSVGATTILEASLDSKPFPEKYWISIYKEIARRVAAAGRYELFEAGDLLDHPKHGKSGPLNHLKLPDGRVLHCNLNAEAAATRLAKLAAGHLPPGALRIKFKSLGGAVTDWVLP
jgi:hypothetical protein